MGIWNTKDYKGQPVTWYSADIVEKIYTIAKWSANYYTTPSDDVLKCAEKHQRIVDIIERERGHDYRKL